MHSAVGERFAAARESWLASTGARMQDDQRVAAVMLTGSGGRGAEDCWSDVDLLVVFTKASGPAAIDDRRDFVATFGDLLFAFDSPWNAPLDGAQVNALYDTNTEWPLYVDWDLWPVARGAVPRDVRVVFDRVGLTHVDTTIDEHRNWPTGARPEPTPAFAHRARVAMLPIVAKYLVRSNNARARRILANLAGTDPGENPADLMTAASALWRHERALESSRVVSAIDTMLMVASDAVSRAG